MPIFRWGQSWRLFHDLEREVDRLLHGVDMTFHGVRFGRQGNGNHLTLGAIAPRGRRGGFR